MQSQLHKKRDYAVYFYSPQSGAASSEQVKKMRKSDASGDMHAGERETSVMLYLRPDLMQMDRAALESGSNQKRLNLPDVYTPIWWYAGFPNHYAGEGAKATKELGQVIVEQEISSFSKALKMIKADNETLKLQNEYFERVNRIGK